MYKINKVTLLTSNRPAIRSLWGATGTNSENFTSWETLTDRAFNARTLDPLSHSSIATKELTKLFMRKPGEEEIKDDRSSVLFPFFAQWLTDSFMRIDPSDRRKNTSNHELDLCQIYGLKAEQTDVLRLKKGGRLRARYIKNTGDNNASVEWDDDDKSNQINIKHRERILNSVNNICQPEFDEYLPLLFEEAQDDNDVYFYNGYKVKQRYRALMDKYIALGGIDPATKKLRTLSAYINNLTQFVSTNRKNDTCSIVRTMYAAGLERGNGSVGYTMFSTLFLREHNRICDALIKIELIPEADDEKLFQMARMINTILYLKIIVQSYIKHISGKKVTSGFYPDKLSKLNALNFGRIKQQWFKPNWISLEFNLLYRWHSLIPDCFMLGDDINRPLTDFFHNNGRLEAVGLDECYKAASQQYANKLCLKNTPSYLAPAVTASLDMSRKFDVAPFVKYYSFFKATRNFDNVKKLCGDNSFGTALATEIQNTYGANSANEAFKKLDFFVGIFAEQKFENKTFGELIYRMVASDAFTHLYRNPLLSPEIFNEGILGKVGIDIISKTESLEDILLRNSRKNRVVANFGIS